MAMASANSSRVAVSGRVSIAGSARAETLSAVVRGATCTLKPGARVSQFGAEVIFSLIMVQYPTTVLTRTAVHRRAGLAAFAACQSNVA